MSYSAANGKQSMRLGVTQMYSHASTHLSNEVRKTVDTYRKLVFVEMYYLKEDGGRSYRVVNGIRMGRMSSGFVYCFDLEAELFLAEDSPIRLTVNREAHQGNVLACEDFQLTILIDRDLGPSIPSAFVNVDPWRLLESLNKRLEKMSPSNVIATKLISEGPKLATSQPISDVVVGQQEAIRSAQQNPITVIWGPPGTGKTYTMAKIAIQQLTAGKRVLAVAHSNISVDGVVSKVAELLRQDNRDSFLWQGNVMRFGHVRNEELSSDEDVVAYLYAIGSDPERKEELERLINTRNELRRSGKAHSPEMLTTQNRIREIRKSVEDDVKRCVRRAKMVATTISQLYANSLFEDQTYDMVMFDEASMAYVPQILCAAMHATHRLVVVGDFRQLSPIVQSRAAKEVLSKDIFSFLGITGTDQVAHAHPWLVMLDEQRRMHPLISMFSSQQFYDRLLRDHPSVSSRDTIAAREPFPNKASILIDLRGTFCSAAINQDHSRFNILGAVITFGTALAAVHDKSSDSVGVGIIAPYVAQVRLIRAMLRDYGERAKRLNVACSTVHQFQGSERDVIVLDTVESYPAKRPGILTGRNESGSVDRLVNVATTRARGKLVVVGNSGFWELPVVGHDNAFAELMMYQRRDDQVVSIRNGRLRAQLIGADLGPNIKAFAPNAALAPLLEDIESAAKKIVISLPDGRLAEPYATTILSSILAAKERGVEVLCKCLGWKELPSEWKKLGWHSDDALFPLLVVDRKVCWYDMPLSSGKVPLGNRAGQVVTEHIALRIVGYSTIGLIVSFTDLESRKVEKGTSKLRVRADEAAGDDEGKGTYGFARYVEQYDKCFKCKQPMSLARGARSKKFYLKCSSCDATRPLPKEEITGYIKMSNARCPTCGTPITARVSKYGLFISCRKRHTMDPDEI